MNLSKLKVLKIGGHYKVKPFDRLIEEYRPQEEDGMPIVICGFNEQMKNYVVKKLRYIAHLKDMKISFIL